MFGQSPTPEALTLTLPEPGATKRAGESLKNTLYTTPLTIRLHGAVGTGKTTFLQSFFAALGIEGSVTSPTYALEQRYRTTSGTPLLHMDLYRLNAHDATQLVQSSAHHEGIRCVEWAELATHDDEPHIDLSFAEHGEGRTLSVTFADIAFPSSGQITEWRTMVGLPQHIVEHCDAVADVAVRLADALVKRGTLVRKEALLVSGRLHDLFRFADFRPGAGPGVDVEDPRWGEWKRKYPDRKHEAVCAEFLREQGYNALATIIASHGVHLSPSDDATVEQMLLFYADKRVSMDKLVSLEERFADFRKRYASHSVSIGQSEIWFKNAQAIEQRLFPEGLPF
jgi:tRNA threonylcarbamoyl adenosine modification protein YjeE